MIDDMQVYIANLGKYNEGELVGDWFSFPLDEEVIAERIGLNAECMTASVSLSHSPVRERFMHCRLQLKAQSEAYRNSQRSW